jgi:hypothetical protein
MALGWLGIGVRPWARPPPLYEYAYALNTVIIVHTTYFP